MSNFRRILSYFKHLKKNSGVGLVTGLMMAGVASAAIVGIVSYTEKNIEISNEGLDEIKAVSIAEKSMAIAGQLISNSLILCKEKPWEDGGPADNLCRWGGNYFDPPIDYAKFGLEDLTYRDGRLVFTANIKIAAKAGKNEAKAEEHIKSEISFQMVDWTDPEVKESIGDIPVENKAADNDLFIIFTQIKVPFMSGEEEKIYSVASGMRRPIAITKLTLRSVSCFASCQTSATNDPNPECRDQQSFGNQKTAIHGTTLNAGPGALYGLTYERTIEYNDEHYPERQSPPPVAVNVMPKERHVIMPGESFTWTDEVDCETLFTQSYEADANANVENNFQANEQEQRYEQSTTYQRDRSRAGTSETTSSSTSETTMGSGPSTAGSGAGTSRSTRREQHNIVAGYVSYGLSVSPFDPENLNDPDFFKHYSEKENRGEMLKDMSENPTLSHIEPQKIITDISETEAMQGRNVHDTHRTEANANMQLSGSATKTTTTTREQTTVYTQPSH